MALEAPIAALLYSIASSASYSSLAMASYKALHAIESIMDKLLEEAEGAILQLDVNQDSIKRSGQFARPRRK